MDWIPWLQTSRPLAGYLRQLRRAGLAPRSVGRALVAIRGFFRPSGGIGRAQRQPGAQSVATADVEHSPPGPLRGGGRIPAGRAGRGDETRTKRQGDAGAALCHRNAGQRADRSLTATAEVGRGLYPGYRQGQQGTGGSGRRPGRKVGGEVPRRRLGPVWRRAATSGCLSTAGAAPSAGRDSGRTSETTALAWGYQSSPRMCSATALPPTCSSTVPISEPCR